MERLDRLPAERARHAGEETALDQHELLLLEARWPWGTLPRETIWTQTGKTGQSVATGLSAGEVASHFSVTLRHFDISATISCTERAGLISLVDGNSKRETI